MSAHEAALGSAHEAAHRSAQLYSLCTAFRRTNEATNRATLQPAHVVTNGATNYAALNTTL
jgi:hypothetical protein